MRNLRRRFGTQIHFTLHRFLHFKLNTWNEVSNLHNAISQHDLCDRMKKKNVLGQLNPMRPT